MINMTNALANTLGQCALKRPAGKKRMPLVCNICAVLHHPALRTAIDSQNKCRMVVPMTQLSSYTYHTIVLISCFWNVIWLRS